MTLENKLGITAAADLAREDRISKRKLSNSLKRAF